MTDVAIRCEGLAKQYRIGERESYKALRDVITDAFASPFRRLRSALRHSSNGSAGSKKPNIWALKDVSFEIRRGEVVGIIGRNGAGKSTLLKILSRITEPTHGHADIWGRIGSLLEVGTGFHPELTGRDNIFLNGAILGMRRAEIARKFDEIVAFAEVEKFIDTPVKRYSSGMYVRLAFAVAAHMETEILLVDEVLAVGDAEFQKKCLGKMGEVARAGRTVFFVSHSMPAVQRLCQRAILLRDGTVAMDGAVDAAVESYLSAQVSCEYVGPTSPQRASITRAFVSWSKETGMVLEVSFVSPIPLIPPILGFVLYDPVGVPVFGANPLFERHDSLPRSMQCGSIRVQVSTHPLRPDTYYISLWLSDRIEPHCYIDRGLAIDIGHGPERREAYSRSIVGSVRLETHWDYMIEKDETRESAYGARS